MSAKNIQEFVALKVIEHLDGQNEEMKKKNETIKHYEYLLMKICKKVNQRCGDDVILEKCLGCEVYHYCEDCICCTDCNRLICDDCSNNEKIAVFVHNYDSDDPLEVCKDCGYGCGSLSLCVSCFIEINEERKGINEGKIDKEIINEEKEIINEERNKLMHE